MERSHAPETEPDCPVDWAAWGETPGDWNREPWGERIDIAAEWEAPRAGSGIAGDASGPARDGAIAPSVQRAPGPRKVGIEVQETVEQGALAPHPLFARLALVTALDQAEPA